MGLFHWTILWNFSFYFFIGIFHWTFSWAFSLNFFIGLFYWPYSLDFLIGLFSWTFYCIISLIYKSVTDWVTDSHAPMLEMLQHLKILTLINVINLPTLRNFETNSQNQKPTSIFTKSKQIWNIQTDPNHLNKFYSWPAVVFIQVVWIGLYILIAYAWLSKKVTA